MSIQACDCDSPVVPKISIPTFLSKSKVGRQKSQSIPEWAETARGRDEAPQASLSLLENSGQKKLQTSCNGICKRVPTRLIKNACVQGCAVKL